ncbi:MAG: ketopantoate reductase family protein, partial [Steroidobacteraceae bacterium]
RLAEVMNRSGMQTVALADARGAQWTKVIFNAATNPIGALTHLPHGVACDQKRLRKLISGLVAEGVAVSKALGITLEMDPEKLIDHAREVAYNHKASMLQDVLAKRRTEVDALNGGIAQFGQQLGIPTPLNEAIYALITALEFSWTRDNS